jgi:hypothetical protein
MVPENRPAPTASKCRQRDILEVSDSRARTEAIDWIRAQYSQQSPTETEEAFEAYEPDRK